MSTNNVPGLRTIFWFWMPLATMWLIMATEQPSITAVVSRLSDPTENLAAFGLTFALALIIESPVIMLLTTGTALATHIQSYRRLLQFTLLLSIVMTALHLLLAVTPLYNHILRNWIGAPEETLETSRFAFLLMLPWTAMIAFRRLWEGVMIRYGHPKRVTIVITCRMVVTVLVLGIGLRVGHWPGAYVGALSLSLGVTMGAIAAWILSRPIVAARLEATSAESEFLSWTGLLSFYTPLALTALITMVAQPILAFGLSHAPLPLKSLAIWPVVMAYLFIGRSLGIALQEVVVALLDGSRTYLMLRRFSWLLAGGITGLFLLLALTPGAQLWYRHISGLTPELIKLAILPTLILALVPGLQAMISWQRGVLVHSKRTKPISAAVSVNLAILLLMMAASPYLADIPGAVWAAIALTSSMAAETCFLWWQSRATATRLATAGAPTGG